MLPALIAVAGLLGIARSVKTYLREKEEEEAERCLELQCQRHLARQEFRRRTQATLLSQLDAAVDIERAKLRSIGSNLVHIRRFLRTAETYLEAPGAQKEAAERVQAAVKELRGKIEESLAQRREIKELIRQASRKCGCRTGSRTCPLCHGKKERRERVECDECDGEGWRRSMWGDKKCTECVGGRAWSEPQVCSKCKGTGRIQCSRCKGTGRLPPADILVRIAAAIPARRVETSGSER